MDFVWTKQLVHGYEDVAHSRNLPNLNKNNKQAGVVSVKRRRHRDGRHCHRLGRLQHRRGRRWRQGSAAPARPRVSIFGERGLRRQGGCW